VTTRAAAVHSGLRLEYVTIAWNVLEAFLALICAAIAGSIALAAFGLDSLVEVVSAGILLWRLHSDHDAARRESVERRALKLVGFSLIALSLYVGAESILDLVRRDVPERSFPGIALAIAALIAMPLLARAKRKVASEIASPALKADSRQSDFCAYLSAILLLGLALNAALGWWWADAVAGLAMVPLIGYEGVQVLRGRTCCQGCA
jgi:divalent metal cation (Fe/Co/Zn/Cd) transporter